jgi:FlaA1/EpsC-like NDP-sugar epimerase
VATALLAFLGLAALREIGTVSAVRVFVVDAVLCTLLVGGSRLTLRLLPEIRSRGRKRMLVVGAGRAGCALVREFRDGHEGRVVGLLDDNPRVRRRRILGVTVLGGLDEAAHALVSSRAHEVLVTIPGAPRDRLDSVIRASEEAGVPCRIVRRRTEFSAPEPVEAALQSVALKPRATAGS